MLLPQKLAPFDHDTRSHRQTITDSLDKVPWRQCDRHRSCSFDGQFSRPNLTRISRQRWTYSHLAPPFVREVPLVSQSRAHQHQEGHPLPTLNDLRHSVLLAIFMGLPMKGSCGPKRHLPSFATDDVSPVGRQDPMSNLHQVDLTRVADFWFPDR